MLRLRPSSSHRWLNCTGSVYFDLRAPEGESSPAAERGTLLHELAERILNGDSVEFPDDEGKELVEDYVKYVKDLAEGYDLRTEVELTYNEHLYGTADAVVIADGEIDVIDLKTGFGFVPVENNAQLMIYALMATMEYGDNNTVAHNHIVQSSIGNVDRIEVTSEQLAEFRDNLDDKIEVILDSIETGNWEFNPSESVCRYCPGRAVCRARKDDIMDSFNEAIELTPTEIDEILLRAAEIRSWLNDIETHALEIVDELDHWELGEGQTMRKWKFPDETIAAALVDIGLTEEQVFQRKIISPAQAEKLGQFDPELVIKPKGKPKLKRIGNR